MRMSTKGIFGFIGALIPLVYVGGLIYYFRGVGGGSMEDVIGMGLGPTILGLSAVGMLFALPVLLKLLRFAFSAKAAASSAIDVGDDLPNTDGFDADAALANYMSKRGDAPLIDDVVSESVPPRAQFGRKAV